MFYIFTKRSNVKSYLLSNDYNKDYLLSIILFTSKYSTYNKYIHNDFGKILISVKHLEYLQRNLSIKQYNNCFLNVKLCKGVFHYKK